MAYAENLRSTFSKMTLHAAGSLDAQRKVYELTFTKSDANPGDTIFIVVPKLDKNEVIVPGSLGLTFKIDLSGGHANNFLVQNVTRALVSKMVVKFGGTTLEDTDGYNIYKTFEDLFLSKKRREGMILEGIQSEDLCKIRSGSGDKKTSGVDAEEKLEQVYGKEYRIRLDHQILTENGVFYPHALLNDLTFQLTLAPASEVVRGSEASQLKYKLTEMHIQYEVLHSPFLAKEAETEYTVGKEYAYFDVERPMSKYFEKDKDKRITINVDSQRKSMKAILILFTEQYTAGARDSEKYIFPDLTKVKVAVNGKPTKVYDPEIKPKNMWEEVERFFVKDQNKPENISLTKFYTDNKFGLLIDLRNMRNQEMHGSGTRIENSKNGVQVTIDRETKGSGTVEYHVFVISDSQLNIMNRQLESADK